MFKLNQEANVDGTCRQSEIQVAPARLVEVFGPPVVCDEYKVSGEYIFEGPEGEVFTLYDWKSTTLYDPYHSITPQAFWSQTIKRDFNIGGHRIADDFLEWLKKKVA